LLGELVARGRASGVETRTPFGQIGEWREGLVFRQTAYTSHSAARAAAGIDLPDVVRRGLEAFNAQDLDAVRELCEPQFEWRPAMAAGVEGRTYVGIEGVERYFAEVNETWDEFWITPGELRDWAQGFVLSVTVHVRGHASGVDLDQPATAVLTLHEGRISAVEMFVDPAASAKAAGLPTDLP
jgi:ketosteroid isomerase-like protein